MRQVPVFAIRLCRTTTSGSSSSPLSVSSPCYYPSCGICFSRLVTVARKSVNASSVASTVTSSVSDSNASSSNASSSNASSNASTASTANPHSALIALQCPKCNSSYASDTALLTYKVDVVVQVPRAPLSVDASHIKANASYSPNPNTCMPTSQWTSPDESCLRKLVMFGSCLDGLFGISARDLHACIVSRSLTSASPQETVSAVNATDHTTISNSASVSPESSSATAKHLHDCCWVQVMAALNSLIHGLPLCVGLRDKFFCRDAASGSWRLLPTGPDLSSGKVYPLFKGTHATVRDLVPWLSQWSALHCCPSLLLLSHPLQLAGRAGHHPPAPPVHLQSLPSDSSLEWDVDPRLLDEIDLTQSGKAEEDSNQNIYILPTSPTSIQGHNRPHCAFMLSPVFADQLANRMVDYHEAYCGMSWQENDLDGSSDTATNVSLEESSISAGVHERVYPISTQASNLLPVGFSQDIQDCTTLEKMIQSQLADTTQQSSLSCVLGTVSLAENLIQKCSVKTKLHMVPPIQSHSAGRANPDSTGSPPALASVLLPKSAVSTELAKPNSLTDVELKMVQEMLQDLNVSHFSEDEESDFFPICAGPVGVGERVNPSKDPTVGPECGAGASGHHLKDIPHDNSASSDNEINFDSIGDISDLDEDGDELADILSKLGLERG
ncbi:hypothetical protein BASA60_003487 [Batrachochytrium salamandrivorans]|nr:hypothetical protein BASA60_003487 [Batrachochytrium salamandrivorans]